MKRCYLMGAMGAKDGGFRPVLEEDDCLIGVDGGLSQFWDWGMEPDHVVGDFDSLGYEPKLPQTQVLPVRKDETDMEFALKLGISLGYDEFIIQGGLGGRIDHSYANFQLLRQLAREKRRGILLGDGCSAVVLEGNGVSFSNELGVFSGICSVFALDEEVKGVTISGLSYEVENVSLFSHRPLGVSNEFVSGVSACISVKEGGVLVIWEGIQEQIFYERVLDSMV